ncbi:MAG: hypothetical protein ABJC26_15640 [Gemmatimonadaceae bacterium]
MSPRVTRNFKLQREFKPLRIVGSILAGVGILVILVVFERASAVGPQQQSWECQRGYQSARNAVATSIIDQQFIGNARFESVELWSWTTAARAAQAVKADYFEGIGVAEFMTSRARIAWLGLRAMVLRARYRDWFGKSLTHPGYGENLPGDLKSELILGSLEILFLLAILRPSNPNPI